jgi:enterochelin esterase-like enzyme
MTRSMLALERLAYHESDGRDLRLDFLRGVAVFAMVVDHLGGPSPLHILTGGNRFFTSAAEGFVFLSGLVAGVVYGRIAVRDGLPVALRRLLGRAATLYVLAISLTLLSLPFAAHVRATDAPLATDSLAVVWSVFTLHQTGYLVDVPLLYALLLLASPLALLLLHQQRGLVMLGVSWAAWLGYQVFPEQTSLPWPIAGNTLFHLAPWQVLFFNGLALGYVRHRLRDALPRSAQWTLLLVSGVGLLALVVLFLNLGPAFALDLDERLFAKSDVGVGRLLASVCVFSFSFLLTTRFWVLLRRALGWLLLPLGQHALYAYTAHVVLVMALVAGLGEMIVSVNTSPWLSAALQLGGVILIWASIRLRLLFPTHATRGWWRLAPVPLALVVALLPPATVATVAARPVADNSAPAATSERLARVFGTPVTHLPDSPPAAVTAAAAKTPSDPAPSSLVASTQAVIHGTFREQVLSSAALGRQLSYYVYLPPDDVAEGRRYPVLYLLHGGGGSKDEWPGYGLVTTVDTLITSHTIRPLIVVMPQGDQGYWVNQVDDGPRWGDYAWQDVVSSVDTGFLTLADADHRAIGGLSMGGAGALQLAFSHPDLFHVVGAHSPALHLDDATFPILGTGADFDQREPIRLAALAPGLEALNIWIDAGEQDPWLLRDRLLHQALLDRGVPHQWRILPGGHEGPYWQANLALYLCFYDAALNDSRDR